MWKWKQGEKEMDGSAGWKGLGLSPKNEAGEGFFAGEKKNGNDITICCLPVESITLASRRKGLAGLWEGCPETRGRATSHLSSRPGLVVAWTSTLAVELKRTGRIPEPLGGQVS